jgi:DNA-binding NarL/FixJ family response regulator
MPSTKANMIRVLLVDDETNVRKGLRMQLALEPDIAVVGEAQDGCAALDLIAALNPDVVLMDVRMGGMDGLEATRCLRDVGPAVVILSLHDDTATRALAFAAGARAFVGKHESSDVLYKAIRTAAGHPPGGGERLSA